MAKVSKEILSEFMQIMLELTKNPDTFRSVRGEAELFCENRTDGDCPNAGDLERRAVDILEGDTEEPPIELTTLDELKMIYLFKLRVSDNYYVRLKEQGEPTRCPNGRLIKFFSSGGTVNMGLPRDDQINDFLKTKIGDLQSFEDCVTEFIEWRKHIFWGPIDREALMNETHSSLKVLYEIKKRMMEFYALLKEVKIHLEKEEEEEKKDADNKRDSINNEPFEKTRQDDIREENEGGEDTERDEENDEDEGEDKDEDGDEDEAERVDSTNNEPFKARPMGMRNKNEEVVYATRAKSAKEESDDEENEINSDFPEPDVLSLSGNESENDELPENIQDKANSPMDVDGRGWDADEGNSSLRFQNLPPPDIFEDDFEETLEVPEAYPADMRRQEDTKEYASSHIEKTPASLYNEIDTSPDNFEPIAGTGSCLLVTRDEAGVMNVKEGTSTGNFTVDAEDHGRDANEDDYSLRFQSWPPNHIFEDKFEEISENSETHPEDKRLQGETRFDSSSHIEGTPTSSSNVIESSAGDFESIVDTGNCLLVTRNETDEMNVENSNPQKVISQKTTPAVSMASSSRKRSRQLDDNEDDIEMLLDTHSKTAPKSSFHPFSSSSSVGSYRLPNIHDEPVPPPQRLPAYSNPSSLPIVARKYYSAQFLAPKPVKLVTIPVKKPVAVQWYGRSKTSTSRCPVKSLNIPSAAKTPTIPRDSKDEWRQRKMLLRRVHKTACEELHLLPAFHEFLEMMKNQIQLAQGDVLMKEWNKRVEEAYYQIKRSSKTGIENEKHIRTNTLLVFLKTISENEKMLCQGIFGYRCNGRNQFSNVVPVDIAVGAIKHALFPVTRIGN